MTVHVKQEKNEYYKLNYGVEGEAHITLKEEMDNEGVQGYTITHVDSEWYSDILRLNPEAFQALKTIITFREEKGK